MKGLPSFISERTAEKIMMMVERRELELLHELRSELGRVQVAAMNTGGLRLLLQEVAFYAAEEAAGAVAIERANDAHQASYNVLQATLAGIELASRKGAASGKAGGA